MAGALDSGLRRNDESNAGGGSSFSKSRMTHVGIDGDLYVSDTQNHLVRVVRL